MRSGQRGPLDYWKCAFDRGQMSISPRAMEIHLRNVIAKLEVESRIGAVRVAVEAAL